MVTIGEASLGVADGSSNRLDFSAFSSGALLFDLALTTPQLLGDSLTLVIADSNGPEDVVGSAFADIVYGNDRPNQLFGAALADGRK